jgi:predicted O-methyltransferase YrrM
VSEQLWKDVDGLFDPFVGEDDALREALRESEKSGLPAIAVAPNQGKLLHLIAKVRGAKSILEIGTLGGYSTIWLGRALPKGGHLISLELSEKHAEVARKNVARAGLDNVEVRVGPALESLLKLKEEGRTFDLAFIDADKPNNPAYFTAALEMSTPGSLIIVDNVVRGGRVADAKSEDAAIIGTRLLYEMVTKEPRVSATAVQTVGTKGHDGFLMALVL